MKEEEEYVAMSFPEVQTLFEKQGFDDNAYLINDEKGIKDFGPCAYFVKKEWLNKVNNYVENNTIILKNQEQSLLWTLYSILDKLAIKGEARDIAIRDFKEHLLNKDLY